MGIVRFCGMASISESAIDAMGEEESAALAC